jgi:hypothetical protein
VGKRETPASSATIEKRDVLIGRVFYLLETSARESLNAWIQFLSVHIKRKRDFYRTY